MKEKYREFEKVERLEALLEEEISARRLLEKQVQQLSLLLQNQKKINDENQKQLRILMEPKLDPTLNTEWGPFEDEPGEDERDD